MFFSRRRIRPLLLLCLISCILITSFQVTLTNSLSKDLANAHLSSLANSKGFNYIAKHVPDTARVKLEEIVNSQSNSKPFSTLFDLLEKARPHVAPLTKYKKEEKIYHAGYDSTPEHVFSEEYLSSFLEVSDEQLVGLRKSHKTFVDGISTDETFNSLKRLVSRKAKGKGVVYVGGGVYNWLSLLSIQNLRNHDTFLPIEVIIPTIVEYEAEFCETILPQVNATCILLPNVLGDEVIEKFSIKGYQYKVLGMLVSSFDELIFLDADNMATDSVDFLLSTYPFVATGLVTWPDFWRRATSPAFYKIAGIDVSEVRVRGDLAITNPEEVPFHDRSGAIPDPSTESGVLLFSKSIHWRSLLLAIYYNIYGPDYYYPLFSQGSDGEGDKETFLASAVVLNEAFYQVETNLGAVGYLEDNEFHGTGMAQYDPGQDYLHSGYNSRQQQEKIDFIPNKPVQRLYEKPKKEEKEELNLFDENGNYRNVAIKIGKRKRDEMGEGDAEVSKPPEPSTPNSETIIATVSKSVSDPEPSQDASNEHDSNQNFKVIINPVESQDNNAEHNAPEARTSKLADHTSKHKSINIDTTRTSSLDLVKPSSASTIPNNSEETGKAENESGDSSSNQKEGHAEAENNDNSENSEYHNNENNENADSNDNDNTNGNNNNNENNNDNGNNNEDENNEESDPENWQPPEVTFVMKENPFDEPHVLFIHANFPKLNPVALLNDNVIINSDGIRRRIYGTGMRHVVGYDFELKTWETMKYLLCDFLEDVKINEKTFQFEAFSKINMKTSDVCDITKSHVLYLQSTANQLES